MPAQAPSGASSRALPPRLPVRESTCRAPWNPLPWAPIASPASGSAASRRQPRPLRPRASWRRQSAGSPPLSYSAERAPWRRNLRSPSGARSQTEFGPGPHRPGVSDSWRGPHRSRSVQPPCATSARQCPSSPGKTRSNPDREMDQAKKAKSWKPPSSTWSILHTGVPPKEETPACNWRDSRSDSILLPF